MKMTEDTVENNYSLKQDIKLHQIRRVQQGLACMYTFSLSRHILHIQEPYETLGS